MSIPKIIHSGLFGGYKATALELRCMESWRRVLPDYEIRVWDDSSGPTRIPFFRDALATKPVKASNYLRFWALYEFGGVFLDTDVEVLKPFDLDCQAFVGLQRQDVQSECVNGAVMGSVKGHWLPEICEISLDCRGAENASEVWTGPNLITQELRTRGMVGCAPQTVDGVRIYAPEVFYPFRWDQEPRRCYITPNTIAIHWWNGSWATRHPNARDNFID